MPTRTRRPIRPSSRAGGAGASGRSPMRRSVRSATCAGWTCSRWGVARRSGPSPSHRTQPASWASTSRAVSSAMPAPTSPPLRRAYRWCARAASRSPCGTRPSTWCSATTVRCRSATRTGSCRSARVLRPGGRLVFNHATLLHSLCYDVAADRQGDRLLAPYHGAHVFDWTEGTLDFHRTYGGWIRLFRDHGLVVDDLIELVPPPDASTTYSDFVPVEWAARWPAEEIWVTRQARRDRTRA